MIKSKMINVAGDEVLKSDGIRLLGAWLDSHMTMELHAIKKAKAASISLMKIRHIQRNISEETCKLLVNSLVTSHLDYCNGIMAGCSDKVVKILQRVQTQSAKLVLSRSKYESSTKALKDLHWLSIRKRIAFKILIMVFNCLNDKAPLYLSSLLTKAKSGRNLRNCENKLMVPVVRKKTFAARSFSVYGPRLWNRLPNYLRVTEDRDDFKSKLKTFLFDCDEEFLLK